MKRALLGFIAASYLALIGVQAAHYHKDAAESKTDSCGVCAMAHQSVQQAPNAAPAAAESTAFIIVVPAAIISPVESIVAAASARAPPAAV